MKYTLVILATALLLSNPAHAGRKPQKVTKKAGIPMKVLKNVSWLEDSYGGSVNDLFEDSTDTRVPVDAHQNFYQDRAAVKKHKVDKFIEKPKKTTKAPKRPAVELQEEEESLYDISDCTGSQCSYDSVEEIEYDEASEPSEDRRRKRAEYIPPVTIFYTSSVTVASPTASTAYWVSHVTRTTSYPVAVTTTNTSSDLYSTQVVSVTSTGNFPTVIYSSLTSIFTANTCTKYSTTTFRLATTNTATSAVQVTRTSSVTVTTNVTSNYTQVIVQKNLVNAVVTQTYVSVVTPPATTVTATSFSTSYKYKYSYWSSLTGDKMSIYPYATVTNVVRVTQPATSKFSLLSALLNPILKTQNVQVSIPKTTQNIQVSVAKTVEPIKKIQAPLTSVIQAPLTSVIQAPLTTVKVVKVTPVVKAQRVVTEKVFTSRLF